MHGDPETNPPGAADFRNEFHPTLRHGSTENYVDQRIELTSAAGRRIREPQITSVLAHGVEPDPDRTKHHHDTAGGGTGYRGAERRRL